MISTSRKGFTLIELLVVIAIIAILAAILFPVFARAKSAAKCSQCQSNLRQMGVAVQMYCDDNGGRYPLVGWKVDLYDTVPGEPPIGERCWRDAVKKYVRNWRVQLCTERPNEKEVNAKKLTAIKAAEAGVGLYTLSYALNLSLTGWLKTDSPSWQPCSVSEVRNPSKTFALAENARTGFSTSFTAWDSDGLTGRPTGWVPVDPNDQAYGKSSYGLHSGGGNVSFVDGHVRYYKFEKWYKICYPAYLAVKKQDSSRRGTPEYKEAWQLGAMYLRFPKELRPL